MSRVVGCTSGFGPGLHGTTVGTLAAGAGAGDAVVAVECDDTEATEGSVTTFTADFEGAGELTANPTAKPMPRAATTEAATPIRTTVLRRMVITPTFRCAKEGNGLRGTARDLGFPVRRWECASPESLSIRSLGSFGDLRRFVADWRLPELRSDALNSRPIRNLAVTPRPARCHQWSSSSSGERSQGSSLESSKWWSEVSMTRPSKE
jgi:hypothetical protein